MGPRGYERYHRGLERGWGRDIELIISFYIRVACHLFFTSFPSMPCYIMNLLLLNNTNLSFLYLQLKR